MAEKEFITKLAAITAIENYACRDCVHSNGKKCEDCEYQDCINFINEVEAADAQSVKRGHWIEKSEEYYRLWQDSGRSWDDMPYFVTGLQFACSNCFDEFEINAEGVEYLDFCPHCGSDNRKPEAIKG